MAKTRTLVRPDNFLKWERPSCTTVFTSALCTALRSTLTSLLFHCQGTCHPFCVNMFLSGTGCLLLSLLQCLFLLFICRLDDSLSRICSAVVYILVPFSFFFLLFFLLITILNFGYCFKLSLLISSSSSSSSSSFFFFGFIPLEERPQSSLALSLCNKMNKLKILRTKKKLCFLPLR